MINTVSGGALVSPQANCSTSFAVDDGEAVFNEDVSKESEYVSDVFGENVIKTEANDVARGYGTMPKNDFYSTEDRFIETRQQMNDAVWHQEIYIAT